MTMLQTAIRSLVIVLVADERDCHALVFASARGPVADIKLRDMNLQIIPHLTFGGLTSQQRGEASDEGERGSMHISSNAMSEAHLRLGRIWEYIVRPLVETLGLEVRPMT
jgi:hypothetical protein